MFDQNDFRGMFQDGYTSEDILQRLEEYKREAGVNATDPDERLRQEIAWDAGLPPKLGSRLRGETREELELDAMKLAKAGCSRVPDWAEYKGLQEDYSDESVQRSSWRQLLDAMNQPQY